MRMDFQVSGNALIAAFAVMAVSLIGVVFAGSRLGEWMQRYITYFATFSGGVFVLVAYHLSSEALHEGGFVWGFSAIVFGIFLMEAIHYVFPMQHHHHEIHHDHQHTEIDGRKVLLSDALHNVGDGVLLVGAFAVDVYVGLAAAVGVIIHEAVQEISEYFILREAGYTNTEALTRNFAASGSILIGIVAASLLSSNAVVLALLAGLAAGGFLSVIGRDLVPHAIASIRNSGGLQYHVVAVLLGAALMFGVQAVLPHEEHEDANTAANTVYTQQ